VLATCLLLLAPSCQAGTTPDDPRFSSLVLTKGIRGGITTPIVGHRVELGYDWNASDYRVTVYDPSLRDTAEGPYSTALIGLREFENILRGVRERGLEFLPPQLDPNGPDTYGINTGLELQDGQMSWANRASGGCTSNPAEVQPTEGERQAFAGIVNGVLDAVAEIALAPGCELETAFLFRPANNGEARAFLRALAAVSREPLAAPIDRSRVDVLTHGSYYEFRFAWRSLQDLDFAYSHMRRKESCDVFVERETLNVASVRCTPFEPSAKTLAGRRAFLESHPDLPSRFAHLIATGWVGKGMTAEMVMAAWGAPRSTDPLSYERHGKSVNPPFDRAGLVAWFRAPSAGVRK